VRDDVQRELVKARLETDVETVDWLNSLMGKFFGTTMPLCVWKFVLIIVMGRRFNSNFLNRRQVLADC
jgi:hypothetical protein